MPNLKKQNAPKGVHVDLAGGLDSTPKSNTDSEVLKSKSTATEVQLAKVLALLRQGPKTTIELRRHSILMPATRVFELKRDHKHTICTELVALYDDAGVRHRKCARYHLIDNASAQGSLDFGGAP